MLVALVLM
jgi:dTDP-D-glucose 4,6-dehydratase